MEAIETKTIETLHEDGVVDGAYRVYGTKDDYAIIFNGYPSDTEDIAILEAYCEENGYEWYYDDSAREVNQIIYTDTNDVIYTDGDVIGRDDVENGDIDFDDDIEEIFIDQPKRCLPYWFSEKLLEDNGFEKLGKTYSSGWYEENDNRDPQEIMESIKSLTPNLTKEIIFKVETSSQFELEYAVFVRSEDIEA